MIVGFILKVILYTTTALIAFAANSLLCRMALAEGYIDAWNFTAIRLLSAAACLGFIMAMQAHYLKKPALKRDGNFNEAILKDSNAILNDKGSWLSSISLVIYALCLSVAYLELDTGTGALILFSAVQLTMIGWGIYNKEHLNTLQWTSLLIAFAGFIYLILPSATTPSLFGALMMAVSGAAWGVYSIRGKACISPLRATGFNFIKSLTVIPILLLLGINELNSIRIEGLLLASASGALTSGLGYSIWYMALPLLKSTQAAVVQLCVPVLAAILGMVFLSEPLTPTFVIASVVILGAVLVFILNKERPKKIRLEESV